MTAKKKKASSAGVKESICHRANSSSVLVNWDEGLDLFRIVTDFGRDMISIHHKDGSICFVSKACKSLLGYDPEELIGKNPYDFIHPDDHILTQSLHERLLDLKSLDEPAIYRYRKKDNEYIIFETIPSVVETSKGIMLVLNSRDVSKTLALRERLKIYHNIFLNIEDGIALLDSNNRYIEQNESHKALLGLSEEELVGRLPSIVLGETLYQEIFKVFDFQGIFSGELKLKSKMGFEFDADLSIYPINSSGHSACSVCIIRDISERKKAENDIIESRRRAQEADHMKTAFLSNMSHEIRTPMNAIVGFSNLLLNPDLDLERRQRYVHFINQNGENLLHLIDDIIDISRIESNQIRIEVKTFNLIDILDELFESINEIRLREQKDKISLEKSYSGEPLYIRTDPYRLRQILMNLLNNAVKYTKKGSILYGFRYSNSNQLEFFVKDTGPGIPDNLKEAVFDRFKRLDSQATKEFKGAGLGLAICRQLITLLGGKIWLESEPGQGSVFYFTLPFIQGSSRDKSHENQGYKESADVSWGEKTILVAEDDPFSYELITEYLKPTGIATLRVSDGKSAVNLISRNSAVSLVLMDIRLPIMNGYEAVKYIRKIRPDLPVIAQSAFAMDEDRRSALAAGCNDFLPKPIDKSLFFKILRKYLS